MKNSQSPKRRNSNRGFTLVEVMVALAIAAMGLTAVAASIGQMVNNSEAMQRRTFASWIAQNRITERQLSGEKPSVNTNSGDVEFAGQQWRWEETVSKSDVENLFRIEVAVSLENDPAIIRTVTGFIGQEPITPGSGNMAWATVPEALGEEQ